MNDRIGAGYDDERHRIQARHDVAGSYGQLRLCERCEGTGNQLFSMFQLCTECDGVGAVEVVDAALGDSDE